MTSRNICQVLFLATTLLLLTIGEIGSLIPSIEEQIDMILKGGLENKAGAIVELGPNAVPVLLNKIRSRQNLSTVIRALGQISDDRAIPVLIEFIESTLVERSQNVVHVTGAIKALKNIEGPGRLEVLYKIMMNESMPLNVRLECAGALSRIDSEERGLVARRLVINIYQTQAKRGEGEKDVDPRDLAEALYEVRTEESRSILSYILRFGQPYEHDQIIRMYKKFPDTELQAKLFEFACAYEEPDSHMKFKALAALSDYVERLPRKKVLSCLDNLKGHLSPEFRKQAEDLENRLQEDD